eukprot:CAMPEP_0181199840 /NCGR_PEP_ID=MMETSP1096-20121128/17406_1 /TAXON_ID=156174 ORGANISM="Chrysochromulina ericina, Strain CCMP281" /NCGR_SAMPLE_ID=MMETSP1096 /ASSEMBLY_ACC=CAM_ASM_000453 /LENGTH=317 /DNA_ID=CAMNT_0023290079 /DNA_START=667 /DNA_END=1620 /DNA_ORIENTATION=-
MVPLAMQSHRVVSGRLEGGARGGEGAEGRASKVFGPAAVGGKAGADGGQVVFVREPVSRGNASVRCAPSEQFRATPDLLHLRHLAFPPADFAPLQKPHARQIPEQPHAHVGRRCATCRVCLVAICLRMLLENLKRRSSEARVSLPEGRHAGRVAVDRELPTRVDGRRLALIDGTACPRDHIKHRQICRKDPLAQVGDERVGVDVAPVRIGADVVGEDLSKQRLQAAANLPLRANPPFEPMRDFPPAQLAVAFDDGRCESAPKGALAQIDEPHVGGGVGWHGCVLVEHEQIHEGRAPAHRVQKVLEEGREAGPPAVVH